jgi:cytochrome oxidase Cu insertion factor (SCO1/SenC/PrrC family)
MDGDYMMDHSTSILLMNPRGQVAALFSAPHALDVLIRDYRACMAAT